MWHSFLTWLFNPYAWNDAAVLCGMCFIILSVYIVRASKQKGATK